MFLKCIKHTPLICTFSLPTVTVIGHLCIRWQANISAIIKQSGLKCLLGNIFYEPIPRDKGAINNLNFGTRTQYLWSEVKEKVSSESEVLFSV